MSMSDYDNHWMYLQNVIQFQLNQLLQRQHEEDDEDELREVEFDGFYVYFRHRDEDEGTLLEFTLYPTDKGYTVDVNSPSLKIKGFIIENIDQFSAILYGVYASSAEERSLELRNLFT